ncbi:uncharacterized protein METZ01_LOCUS314926, partial [marine metagenome]
RVFLFSLIHTLVHTFRVRGGVIQKFLCLYLQFCPY